MKIRPILPGDNEAIKDIIQSTILEYGAPKIGTAYSDIHTQSMYKAYQQPRSIYYVIESGNTILGGAGVAALDNFKGNLSELQKMYFLPAARNKGLGKKMIELCIHKAREMRYSGIYLETMDNMIEAQGLYKKMGFNLLEKPLGDTGHFSCPVQMLLNLND